MIAVTLRIVYKGLLSGALCAPTFHQSFVQMTLFSFSYLTGALDSAWVFSQVARDGLCCESEIYSDRCIQFTIVLDEESVGLTFSILVEPTKWRLVL